MALLLRNTLIGGYVRFLICALICAAAISMRTRRSQLKEAVEEEAPAEEAPAEPPTAVPDDTQDGQTAEDVPMPDIEPVVESEVAAPGEDLAEPAAQPEPAVEAAPPAAGEPAAEDPEAPLEVPQPEDAASAEAMQEGGDAPAPTEAEGDTAQEPGPEDLPLPPPPTRKHRWGPPMNLPKEPPPEAEPVDPAAAAKAERKRKRKSRWEEDTTAMAIVPANGNVGQAIVLASFPKAVVLSNGMEVRHAWHDHAIMAAPATCMQHAHLSAHPEG